MFPPLRFLYAAYGAAIGEFPCRGSPFASLSLRYESNISVDADVAKVKLKKQRSLVHETYSKSYARTAWSNTERTSRNCVSVKCSKSNNSDDAEEFISKGWRFAGVLPNGKVVLERNA